MIINNNLAALQVGESFRRNEFFLKKSHQKLATGKKINMAADDASGQAISQKMQAQIRGLNQASLNAEEASSLLSTAESSIETITDIMLRMRDLSVKAANETTTEFDRGIIQREINDLANTITEVASNAEFNTIKLLDGSIGMGSTKNIFNKTGAVGEFKIEQISNYVPSQLRTVTLSNNAGTGALNMFGKLMNGDVLVFKNPNNLGEEVYFEFVSNGSAAKPGNIAIGIGTTVTKTAENLAAALNQKFSTSDFIVVPKTANSVNINWQGHSLTDIQTIFDRKTGLHKVESTSGKYQFQITENLNFGDTIELNDFKFTAGKDFQIGASTKETTTNLAAALQKLSNQQIPVDWPNQTIPADFETRKIKKETVKKAFVETIKNMVWDHCFPSLPSDLVTAVADAAADAVDKGQSLKQIRESMRTAAQAKGFDDDDFGGSATLDGLAALAQVGTNEFFMGFGLRGIIKDLLDIPAMDNTLKYDKDSFNIAAWSLALTTIMKLSDGCSLEEASKAGIAAGEKTYEPSVNECSFQGIMNIQKTYPNGLTWSAQDSLNIINEKLLKELHQGIPYNNPMSRYNFTTEGNTIKITERFDYENDDEAKRFIVGTDLGPPIFTSSLPTISSILIDGTPLHLQIGANSKQAMVVSINDMRAKALGILTVETAEDNVAPDELIDVMTHDRASASLDIIDAALAKANAEKAKLGVYRNRLDHTMSNLDTSATNATSAMSRIVDADMPKEIADKTANDLKAQIAQSMLKNTYQIAQDALNIVTFKG